MSVKTGNWFVKSCYFGAAALALTAADAQAGSQSISSVVNGSPMVISASTDRFAGAIESLTYRGVQYVDIADHGRQIQSAIQLDGLGECLNPNEAGSVADGAKLTSQSILLSISTTNNFLTTLTRPAYWLAPGQQYPTACSPSTTISRAVNTTVLSDYRIGRTTRFFGPSIPNLLLIDTTFTVPETRSSASVEALTGYLPPSFTTFLTYDRNERRLTKLFANSSNQQTSTPVIVARPNGAHAMGVLSNAIPNTTTSTAAYYAYFYFGGQFATAKWSCVFAQQNLPANSTYTYSCPIAVGTVDEVVNAMNAYTGAAPSEFVPVYRFYRAPKHFMTRSYAEGAGAGFTFETTGFRLFGGNAPGRTAMYRCYNPGGADHFMSTQSNCEGQNQEGILGFASTAPAPGLVPLYRFYRNSTASHLMTVNFNEGIANGFVFEGTLGFVAS